MSNIFSNLKANGLDVAIYFVVFYSIRSFVKMSHVNKPSFIVRKIELNDCDEVAKLWKSVGFNLSYYQNHIMMKVDSDAIQVAQDIKTGDY